MPVYSYLCESCGSFDLYQPFTAETLTVCPECGGKVRKVFTPPAIFYPGRAWAERADAAAEYDTRHPVRRGQWPVSAKPNETP